MKGLGNLADTGEAMWGAENLWVLTIEMALTIFLFNKIRFSKIENN